MLNITEVRVRVQTYASSSLRGYADITIGGGLVVKGFKIMEHAQNGLWIAMPSKKNGEKYDDQVFPLNADARQELTDIILKEYAKKSGAISDDTTFKNENESDNMSGFAAIEGDDDIPF